MSQIRVVIADDHSIARVGMRHGLVSDDSLKVVGECSNATEIFSILEQEQADILFLDLRMPDEKNTTFRPISGIKRIRTQYPKTKIVVVSAYLNPTILEETLESDIRGYVLKDDLDVSELPHIAKTVQAGKLFISENVRGFYQQHYIYPSLTTRQKEIIELLALNLDATLEELAAKLHISPQTLRNQLRIIYREMGVVNKTHCIAMSIALGIIEPPDHRYML